ncbi:MAG: quinol:cytochrome C oxidoreductase, partial [Alphaproteobacteria bacterium]|nr:quinol:cytochrome C oxidoreductase [Alphaproteobacteria bacterium]
MAMYTFAQRLKITAFVLMGLGFIGLAIGFASTPSTVAEAQAMVADAHGGHGDAHGSEHNAHDTHATDSHKEDTHHDDAYAADAHGEHHDDAHGEHLLHQLQNKPWAALYVAAFFFFMIALGTLAFYAIQRAAQAGWPILLYRVMEGITAYLVPGSIIIYVFLVLTGLHANHLFVWMDAETVAHDEIIQGKVGYLNVPFFLIRAAIYLLGWNAYRYFSRKFSLAQDNAPSGDISNHKKNFRISAGFLVFFFVTESMMAWDWIMS